MDQVQVTVRNTVFDVELDADGVIETIKYNGKDVFGLMFDMGFTGDFVCAVHNKQLKESTTKNKAA